MPWPGIKPPRMGKCSSGSWRSICSFWPKDWQAEDAGWAQKKLSWYLSCVILPEYLHWDEKFRLENVSWELLACYRICWLVGWLVNHVSFANFLGYSNLSNCIQIIHSKLSFFWILKSHFATQETIMDGSKITWYGWHYLCPHWISSDVPFSSSSFLNRY